MQNGRVFFTFGEYNTALANQGELFTCVGYTTNSFFTQRCQKKSKKPTSQDGKVIWEFLKLANNAGTIYSKVLRWCVKLPILLCALGLWDIFVVVVVLQRFFEIADMYVQFTYSLQTRHRARFTYQLTLCYLHCIDSTPLKWDRQNHFPSNEIQKQEIRIEVTFEKCLS